MSERHEAERAKQFDAQFASAGGSLHDLAQYLRPTSVPVVPREQYIVSPEFERERASNKGKGALPPQTKAIM